MHRFVHIESKLIRRWLVGWDWVKWARHALEPSSHGPSSCRPHLEQRRGLKGICRVSGVPPTGGVPLPGLWDQAETGSPASPKGSWSVRGCSAKLLSLGSSSVEHLPAGGQCIIATGQSAGRLAFYICRYVVSAILKHLAHH